MGNKNPIPWRVAKGILTLQKTTGRPSNGDRSNKLKITKMNRRRKEARSRLLTPHFLHFPHFEPPKCGKCVKCRVVVLSRQVISRGNGQTGRRLAYEL